MSEKNQKELLLSSGIPLEYSVLKIYESMGYLVRSDYEFVRLNEDNKPVVFSVDCISSKRINYTKNEKEIPIGLCFLNECKYRFDGVKWIFIPHSTHRDEIYPIYPIVTLDNFSKEFYFNPFQLRQSFIKDMSNYSSRYVEILPREANQKGIKEGINQLRYAFAKSVIENSFSITSQDEVKLVCLMSILVTTADLYMLQTYANLDAIKKSKDDFESFSHKVDYVFHYSEPNHELKEHFILNLRSLEKRAYTLNPSFNKENVNFNSLVQIYGSSFPKTTAIVHYSYLEKFLNKLENYFQMHNLLAKR